MAAPGRPGGGAGSASSSAPGAPVLHWLGGGAARRTATAGAVAEHYAAQKTAEGAAPSDSSPEAAPPAAAAAPVRADASAAALGVTAAQGAAAANAPGGPDTEAMAAADVPAAEAAPKTGGEAAVAAEGQRGRPASETTEASADADPKLSGQKAASVRQDRSWDGMLMRFAESSLSKGGPLPSLQVCFPNDCQILIRVTLDGDCNKRRAGPQLGRHDDALRRQQLSEGRPAAVAAGAARHWIKILRYTRALCICMLYLPYPMGATSDDEQELPSERERPGMLPGLHFTEVSKLDNVDKTLEV